jgi:hypothetical protein
MFIFQEEKFHEREENALCSIPKTATPPSALARQVLLGTGRFFPIFD